MRRVAVALLAAVLAACAGDDHALDGEELRALYSNRIVEGRHELRGFRFRSFYAERGAFFSYRTGTPGLLEGTWWVDGGEVCIRWKASGETYCRVVLRDARGRYRKVLVRGSGEEVDVVEYSSFTRGTLDALSPP